MIKIEIEDYKLKIIRHIIVQWNNFEYQTEDGLSLWALLDV